MRSAAAAAVVFSLLCLCAFAQAPPSVPAQPAQTAPDAKNPADTPRTGTAPAAPPLGGENQLFLEVKWQVNNTNVNDIIGTDGRPTRSFLTPGGNTGADFTYFQDHSFGVNNRIQVLGIFRNTNDIRIDPEQNSFQRGYIRITTPATEWNFGDYLVNFSRFTYNQNIKGLNVIHKFSDKFRVSANAGVFTDRWGSVFKDDINGKPFTRIVAGFRAEERFTPDKVVGFNFSHGRDLRTSIRQDLQAGFLAADNQIFSVDTRMSFGRVFSLDGEAAFSNTNPDTFHLRTKNGDYGLRLDTTTRQGSFSLKTSFTRMMPAFLSSNARQLADLQDSSVRAAYDVGSHVTVEGSYRYTSNNLDNNRREGTTAFRVPEVRMSFRQLPHLGRSIFDVGYRERQQKGPLLTSPAANTDRNTKIPFVEMSVPMGTTLISAGFEHRFNEDYIVPANNTGTNRFSASLRSILDMRGWQFSPLLRYEIEREAFPPVFGANDNRTIQAAGYLEAPKYFVFEFIFRQIGASLFSQCLTTSTDQCSARLSGLPVGTSILLPSGFGRPAYRGAVTYKIKNSDDRTLILSLDRNSNFFALRNRDFDERVIALTFLYRYKK